jgi:heat shock protein HspQ
MAKKATPATLPAPAPARKRTPRKRKSKVRSAKFAVGQVVRHRFYPFRGVIFDIDPVFANSEEWWQSIPKEIRPVKDQPFYHLLAENAETEYIAYVSEQNLLPDETREPLRHPQLGELFSEDEDGTYRARFLHTH